MQGLWRLWSFICWKAIKSRSLISSFNFQILVLLAILDLHLSIQTCRELISSTDIEYHFCSTSYSMWQRYQAVSISARNGRFWIKIFNLARINLAHMLGALTSHSQATVCFSFRFMDRATLPDYREPDPLCTRSCCATYHNFQHKFNFLSLRESGRYVH